MNERRTIVAAFLAGCLLITTTGMAQTARILTEHGREVVGRLQPLGDIDAGANLQVAVGLPLHNKEALTNLLNDLYDPSSPQFHRYLSVSQFTEKFGPSAEDYQKVIDYLTSRHLKVITTHANRMVVGVSGAGADMEKAFHVHLRNYQHPTDQRTFFAPDTEPRVDAGVPMLDVMGLDNYIVPHPRDLRRKPLSRLGGPGITNYGGPGVTNYSSEEGSGPGGLYMASDLRTAYYPGVTNTGAGQYVAVFEFGPYWTNDIYTYETNCGLSTNIVVSNIFLDGVTEPPTAGTDAGEQAGDVEYEMAIAPGATILYYGGGVANDIFGRMASDNLAGSISDSWGFGIDSTTEQLWQEFVAQGQTLFAASGDGGATVAPGNIAGPYVCLVGGTELFTVSPGGAWASEVVWPGSGGGVGTMYAIPNYQQGINMAAVNGSMTMRNTPDVATFAIGLFLAANGSTGWGGGTSFSSPQYAGMIALVNQQAAILGKPRVGFFNPALYAIGKSTNYTNCFHDITVGNNTNSTTGPDKFIAATGYDLCTGWGSPNGSNLINALVGFGTNNFLLSANPDSINLTIGGSETVLVLAQPMNGFNGTVSLSVSGAPTGLADSFSSSSTTSTSILTLSAGTTATPGTYTINLNGASGSISQTIAIAVNIVGETPGFSKVSLASEFNRIAIYTDGAGFSSGGGADASGNAYSANLLGSALNWNGCLFNEGSANANDAIVCSGQTISLPSGNFSSLQILAAGVGSAQLSQPFTVTYTDGSTSIFSRSLSVWNQNQIVPGPLNFPGESVVATTIYANTSGGTKDITMNAYIYGYSFGLNNTKTVKSITLPGDGNVLVFAMTLANDFTLYDLPSSLVLTAGGTSRSYLVSGPVASFSGDVALSASGLPAEVTASFSPSASTNFSILTLTANATAQPTETNVILTGTLDGIVHNVDLNLAVMTPIPNTVAVSLSSAFNCDGTYNDGTTFSAAGGLDGAGNAFSANLLGSSANWNGGFFSFGPAGSPDAVQCAGQTITLPAGQYTGLLLLGAAINSSQANQSFQIKYTDGTSATVNQSMSVWTTAQNYPGESIAVSTAHIDTSSGTNNTEIPVNLYGYTLPLNDSKTVQSITLPNNSDAVVLALTLANAPTSVSLASSFNRGALYTDGTSFSGGLDGDGNAYSATQLGSSPIWDGVQFKLGAANVNNVISCDGQTISLPANRYTSLLMLATGVNGSQTSQNFSVTYTDGTVVSFDQSLSDWVGITDYPNQFIATAMPYRLFDGSESPATTFVYGYLFPLNNTKTVKSFKLPDNGNVEVLAVSLANSPLPVSLQADYNRAGIYTEGTIFTNGLDNDGNALSANLLGATETWHDSLFAYGQPNVTNVVSATGRTISMPQGQYSALLMLAACVNGSQSSQSFTVHYTNGTSTSFIQSMSDWAVPQYFSGETIVEAMGARAGGGSFVPPPVNVYGYTMSLDSNNVVQSLTLPNNGNVEVLALTLSNYTAAVAEAPAIVAQPAGLTVTNGGPASFTVAATGTPALTYQWQLNGTNLTDGGSIGGSSTAALTLSSADATNTGTYDVIVSNSYGSVTSSAVTLNVFFSLQSAVQDSDGSFSFSWLTTPGVPYQVQYTTNLASSNWVDLGAALIASNGVTSATDTNNVDAQRFYRVVQQ